MPEVIPEAIRAIAVGRRQPLLSETTGGLASPDRRASSGRSCAEEPPAEFLPAARVALRRMLALMSLVVEGAVRWGGRPAAGRLPAVRKALAAESNVAGRVRAAIRAISARSASCLESGPEWP